MIEKILTINEVDATHHPVVYTCHGIGSCVALFLTDPSTNITGGAHISLFISETNQSCDVCPLINELLQALKRLGSDLTRLRAKLTGGAKVLDSSFNIGKENASAVVECLIQKKIFIMASDLGGTAARTVHYTGSTGQLKISTSDQKVYYI